MVCIIYNVIKWKRSGLVGLVGDGWVIGGSVDSGWHELSESIWFVWSNTSQSEVFIASVTKHWSSQSRQNNWSSQSWQSQSWPTKWERPAAPRWGRGTELLSPRPPRNKHHPRDHDGEVDEVGELMVINIVLIQMMTMIIKFDMVFTLYLPLTPRILGALLGRAAKGFKF